MTKPDPRPLAEQFGALLGEERRRQGLTLRQMADRIGISNPTLHTYEHGRSNLTLAKVQQLADAVGLQMEFRARRVPESRRRAGDTPEPSEA